MPSKRIKEFLNENNIKYVVIEHSLAYTSQEIAASAHIKGRNIAKTVLVKIDGSLAMTVLPATNMVDFEVLKKQLGKDNVRLADEQEFCDKFPGCEVGAMPPFGNLFGMDVYVAEALTKDVEIAFNAGTHVELIQMTYKDFEKLVKPKIFKFTYASKL